MSDAVQPDQPVQPVRASPSRSSQPASRLSVDEVTEINPDVVIAPEDIGVPVVAEGEKLLEVDEVTLRFGGVVALNEVSFHINKGEILGPHRSQRRRQDDLLQRHDGRLPAHLGCGALPRRAAAASARSSRSPSSASPARSRTSGSSPT